MLSSGMFGSRSPLLLIQPPFFSANSASSALKSPRIPTTRVCTSPTVQLLPSFSTPSQDRAHTTTCGSLPPYAFLPALPDTLSKVLLPTHAFINPLDATLTSLPVRIDSKQLTQSLNPLNATLTKRSGASQRSAWSASLGSLPLYFITSLPRFRYTICRDSP